MWKKQGWPEPYVYGVYAGFGRKITNNTVMQGINYEYMVLAYTIEKEQDSSKRCI